MSPRKRNKENKPLPSRWVYKHGAFYYVVPASVRDRWDGKAWFLLGHTLAEAHRAWADRVEVVAKVTTINQLLDRYELEHLPKKSAKTQTVNRSFIAKLRPVFGHMSIHDLEPQHVYLYFDKRSSKTAAKREIEILRHAFTKAVSWGLLKSNPLKGEVVLEGQQPRTRYVEDWEIDEVLSMIPHRKKGSTAMVQAYLRLKLLTGLRQRDLLLLKVGDCKADGIHVTPSKTKRSTGKRIIYEWTPELRRAYESALSVRPTLSPYVFCDTQGRCMVNEETGEARPFNHMWQNFIARALKETKITERFTEHDLRAKVGSDAESLERAQQLLAHSDSAMTRKVYRRKPERIKPAGGNEK